MNVTAVVDTRNLMRAQKVFLQYTRQVPAQAVNRTALFVIRDVQRTTPVTSQARIDEDLNVSTSPAMLMSGKLSTDKRRQHEVIAFGNRTPDKDDLSAVNEAYRIVLARMHPGSAYSISTGNRWPVPIPDFGRGRGRGAGTDSVSLFWAYVKQVAERMVRARHSSTGFLKHSWSAIIYKLLPHVPPSYRGGFGGTMDMTGINQSTLLSGVVEPAEPGSSVVVCTVSNTLGINNGNMVLGDKYNEALHRICVPLIQAAVDRETDSKMAEAARRGWTERAPELATCGVLVRLN